MKTNSPRCDFGEGRFILLTGLSGSGKTTLGNLLLDQLTRSGPRPVTLLDGDVVRAFFDADQGYSESEREEASKRMAFGAHTLIRNGFDVIVANIAARASTRSFFRSKFQHYVEIFLDAPMDQLQAADPKGIYTRAKQGKEPLVIGIDLPYDPPKNPDLHLRTHLESVEESLQKLTQQLNRIQLGTKGQTLLELAPRTRRSIVPPLVTIGGDTEMSDELFQRMARRLNSPFLAVRSSASCEDQIGGSMAGVFQSVLNVTCDRLALTQAIQQVRASYQQAKLDPNQEEILIQTQVQNVALSGVALSRHLHDNSPYRVISYDRGSGRTDTVTAGQRADTVFLDRFQDPAIFPEWRAILDAVLELEHFFPNTPLDIEFAVDEAGKVYLFQCRALVTKPATNADPASLKREMDEARARLTRIQRPPPHLVGRTTVLSNMADWNPAEIIGEKPSTLAYSLYRELICDETWRRARVSQGYRNAFPSPLMVSICRRGYMDTRASMNSFIPATVPDDLAEKLVNGYLDRLIKFPQLHDKIEFEIAQTAWTLQLGDDPIITQLTPPEQKTLSDCLRHLTNDLIVNGSKTIQEDLQLIGALEIKRRDICASPTQCTTWWEHFEVADLLLSFTRDMGALPFARIARLAFIAKTMLRSLQQANHLPSDFIARFEAGLDSPAGALSRDMEKLSKGTLDGTTFFDSYGHLRMNTYDIESARYDQIPIEQWRNNSAETHQKHPPPPMPNTINEILQDHGLEFDTATLQTLAVSALEGREWAKFQFTRTLSQAIEHIAAGAATLGISRADCRFLTLSTIRKQAYPEYDDPRAARHFLTQKIAEKRRERAVFDLILLPPVIMGPENIDQVSYFDSQPNYITNQRVSAHVFCLDQHQPIFKNLKGKIVVIENADPGYDWIFAHQIGGLITKYGGAASHMAIRCAELNLPGAIGVGERLFQRVSTSAMVDLDCDGKSIQVSGESV